MNPWRLGAIAIGCDVVPHPLLGEAFEISHAGRTITAVSTFDRDRPTTIPAIAEPARLPPGEGARLLNAIAERATGAGVTALRYAGPYPTPALYRALLRSFRASADEDTFTHDVLGRMLRLARDEVPVDFTPAPHVRVDHAHGHAELRDGVERAVVDATAYERDGAVARLTPLREAGAAVRCEIRFGDRTYATIAELDARGALVGGPHPPPPFAHAIVGQTFPAELRDLFGELIAARVPSPLADDAHRIVRERGLRWADLGTRAARRTDDGFELHGALWTHVGPHGLARLADALAEALAPVVTATLVAELAPPPA